MKDKIAQDILLKLLTMGNKSAAGVRKHAPALTATKLKAYGSLRNWHQKNQCEEVFLEARDLGAIRIVRDKLNPNDGLIERIELVDTGLLAQFLNQTTHADVMIDAMTLLEPYLAQHDVLEEVISKWSRMANVRGSGPTDARDWVEAITVIDRCSRSQDATLSPVRETSARLLRNSKRIEQLTAQLDVLLQGSIEAAARAPTEVWQELGLFKEEQPVLLAGNVTIARTRVTALLDEPYTGLPASAVQSISGLIDAVLTIENLTTFHSEAKRHANRPTLLIYTAGMPSPAWRAMYHRLLTGVRPGTPIYHWGDVDEGGFRIASVLAKTSSAAGHTLLPHAMTPDHVPEKMRRSASKRTLMRMKHFAEAAGWPDLGEDLFKAGFVVEQEAL
ncbi:Wadjet anti-phage system protein JetD domain-containing protein [Pseudomonas bohemica]|uniref:Wadjet anti-phage system protein JetD domain-containing protein n=1 Tax=Pseudomonas bohemica TaxID=2044872 RepID=UPI000DA5F5CC|nr:Wadjet anti-phage system protein JetD domain-containing protein [Pseudomonas bohemica]